MPRAPKPKQSNAKSTPPVTTRSKARAPASTIDKTTGNPHRKNSKLWKEWEAVNNPSPPVEPAIVNPSSNTQVANSTSLTQNLLNLTTRLQALDDNTTDKLDNLDSLLDNKIELLADTL